MVGVRHPQRLGTPLSQEEPSPLDRVNDSFRDLDLLYHASEPSGTLFDTRAPVLLAPVSLANPSAHVLVSHSTELVSEPYVAGQAPQIGSMRRIASCNER
jgi:hypothetical protein